MNERIAQPKVYQLQPAITKSLIALGQAAQASGLEASLIHLIKLRASQINGCAYCLHLHANEARKDGESQTRLDLLSAWHEVPIFNAREKAALKWTEILTLIANGGVTDEQYNAVADEFTQEEIVNLTAAIVTINSWNRISIGFHFLPKLD
jgi:AhpD family alkylhydroperoxidase